MKPNLVLGLMLLAILAVGVGAFLKRHPNWPAPVPVAIAAPAPRPATVAAPLPPPPTPAVSTTPAPVETPDEEIDHLQEWSRNDDPQSLLNILADLANPDKGVREAAIEAAKQFGSTNAIPALKTAAMNSTDPDEQIEMLQAASFLALPSIGSIHLTPEQMQAAQARAAQLQAQAQAQRQAQAQGHGQSVNAPVPSAPQPPPQ